MKSLERFALVIMLIAAPFMDNGGQLGGVSIVVFLIGAILFVARNE